MYHVVLLMAFSSAGDLPVIESGHGAGCMGQYVVSSGCHGCFGCAGCQGGCYGAYPGLFDRLRARWHGGCYGCVGGMGASGGFAEPAPAMMPSRVVSDTSVGPDMPPALRMAPATDSPPPSLRKAPAPSEPLPLPRDKDRDEAARPARAIIVVHLPPEATLTVDGAATHLKSAVREFKSPLLPPGEEFTYRFQAVLNRDGETVTASRRVTVRAGQRTRLDLEFPSARMVQR